MKPNFLIGDKVSFNLCYDRNAQTRFKFLNYNDSYINSKGSRIGTLTALSSSPTEGWVVGLRHVIMSNYIYHYSGSTGSEADNQSYATGDRELVLLVTPSLRREPFIVRIQDIIKT